MAYLQFEAIGINQVKTEVSVSYVDHNTLQTDFKNPDDHRYLQSVARVMASGSLDRETESVISCTLNACQTW